ncbi:slit homolog 1 protein-like [Lytechinus pictus]|uniref:slit homolog 1 protein-like n=1 Tax=Lytechinus pictus TaxID=7653 RepID=UPI0030BA28EB
MLAVNTTMNASRVSSCLGILLLTMSLLLAERPFKDVSGSLSSESTEECILKNTSLGTKAICTHLHLKSVPQDLPRNTVMVDLSFNKISTLFNGSFAYYPNITSLGLEHNVLSKIEHGAFESLSHLRKLSLRDNILVSLPPGLFRENRFLSILILGKNRLVSFPRSALPWSTSITTLDVSQNRIAFLDALDFEPLQNCSLEKLYLRGNALQTLPFKVFSYLKTVNWLLLSHNNFQNFIPSVIIGRSAITHLDLNACKIEYIISGNKSHIALEDHGQISMIIMKGNRIRYLPDYAFWGFNQTKKISLHRNRVANLSSKSFCGLDNLIDLDLSYNCMTTLSFKTFSCLHMLSTLKLNSNQIASLFIDLVSGLFSLSQLNLAHNNIEEIPRSNVTIPSVEYIDLSFNKFKTIRRFLMWSFTNLQILNMSNNGISQSFSPYSFINLRHLQELHLTNENQQLINGAFRYLGHLQVLDLSFAPLKITTLRQFTNASSLNRLIMRDCSLKSADIHHAKTNRTLFWGLNSLIVLDLRQNQFDMLAPGTFNPMKKLRILYLSQCTISVLSCGVFDSLTALTTLDVRDNAIMKVPESLLQRQHHLAVLFLGNNKLETIPRTLFKETTSLHSLFIQQNRITTIEPMTSFPTNTTLRIDAAGNPFSCTCQLSWFVKWLRSGNIELRLPKQTLCSLTSIKAEVDSPILTFNPDKYCGINFVMITSVCLSGLLVLVIGLVAYRQRWWLNYKFFLLKLAIFGYEEINHEFDAQDYEYQLNIMYNEDDQEWVDGILKPVLRERFPHLQKVAFGDNDLNIAMFYINALHYVVDNSFKTVLLISYNCINDAWFLTKLRIALEQMNDTKLDMVILIFLEDIRDADLPYLVRLFLSKNKPYMLWTDDEDGQELFWAQFEKSMRSNRAINSVIPV